MNPYQTFVEQYAQLLAGGTKLPLGNQTPLRHVAPGPGAPKALIFSPHPDDEVIIGGLPLRLRREVEMNVINVAVTQGSDKARQAERWKELTACCDYVGFGLVATSENGLEGVNMKTRTHEPELWAAKVDRIAAIMREHKPRVIFFPQHCFGSLHDQSAAGTGRHTPQQQQISKGIKLRVMRDCIAEIDADRFVNGLGAFVARGHRLLHGDQLFGQAKSQVDLQPGCGNQPSDSLL